MTMNDGNTTLNQLKEQVYQMCLRKGWGVEGVQNPQHVAMAMTVEMSELLEHFQWLNPDDVQALMAGRDPERVALYRPGAAQDRHRGPSPAQILQPQAISATFFKRGPLT